MDMFNNDLAATNGPIETFQAYIERGDAKGAIHFLRSLNKEDLGYTLLRSGFKLGGDYKDWVNYAGAAIQEAAMHRRLPRQHNASNAAR